ncbi:O-antigen ligase family protein [Ferrovibrio sp.]|uniref:O-antigen ligase family protein n=1 Tax=Ferrovibrio sp. TaxID=1917215 RepID=UPI003D152C9E
MNAGTPLRFFTTLAPAASLMAFFAAKGFAALGVVAGLTALILLTIRRDLLPALSLPSTKLLGAWILLGWASALWSIDRTNSLETMQGLSALLIAAACLLALAQRFDATQYSAWHRHFAYSLIIGFTLLVALLLFDQLSGGKVYAVTIGLLKRRNDWIPNLNIRAGVFVTLSMWPALLAAYWLHRRPILPLALLLLGAIAAYISPQVTAKLAFCAGLGTAILIRLGGRITLGAIMLVIGLSMLLLPVLLGLFFNAETLLKIYPNLHYSAVHRLHVWDFVAERFLERPWLGWGIDAARALPGAGAMLPSGGEQVPSHPHNGVLQFWLELGIPGGLLLLAGHGTIWHALSSDKLRNTMRAAGTGCYVTALIYFLASFNSWHSWWIGFLGVSFSLLLAALRSFGNTRS